MTIAVSALAAALVCAGLIVVLRPLLVRYALARPNARSSHRTPTPQGGGIAVMAAAGAVAAAALALDAMPAGGELVAVAGAALGLAIVGAVDDIRPLPAALRLLLQILAVGVVVTASGDVRILPALPLAIEHSLLIFAGVWFVNLVNFMDGIDWITVAELVPLLAVCALALSMVEPQAALLAGALVGALIGFAPFNKPVARLFLGDVGALPLGLLAGWMLLKLAGAGALAAAVLLPLYYLADATITLLRRLMRGERVWEAHRDHFYQRAIDRNGFSVMAVAGHVLALNLALAVLALVSIHWPAWPVQIGALAAGSALVAGLIVRLATPRPGRAPA